MASIPNYFIHRFFKQSTKNYKASENNISAARRRIGKLMIGAPKPEGVSFKKITCNGVTAEWNIPQKTTTEGVILYIHGGAYVTCSVGTHRALVARIAKACKTKCLSVDYSLAPENPFPKALNEVLTVYNYLLEQGYPSAKIVLMGDSAGGGLAMATALKLRDNNTPLPVAIVGLSPWLNLACNSDSCQRLIEKDPMLSAEQGKIYGKIYAGTESVKHPYISPSYADLKGMPAMYIQVSDAEILLDENVDFAEKAKQQGVDATLETWKNMVHVWHGFGFILPEAKKAIHKIGKYVNKKLN